MLAAIIGWIFVAGGVGLALLALLASGFHPQGRGMGETVGYWPLAVAAVIVLLGLGLVFT